MPNTDPKTGLPFVIIAEDTYDEKAYDNCMAKKQRMTNLLSLFE